MRKSYKSLKMKYNQELANNNQILIIIDWVVGRIVLSNGTTLDAASDIRNFRNHVMSPMLGTKIDILYASGANITTLVKEIQRSYAATKNKEWWNNLDPVCMAAKQHHMRTIQKLVDRSSIVFPDPWNKGKTKFTDARLAKNSEDRSGPNNPMYGTRHTDEQKRQKSEWVKGRIERGEWTPHAHNSRTHWDCSYKGKRYRSSWEVMYASLNNDDEYETIRIPYIIDGVKRIYIVDFFNNETKVLTEIKPRVHTTTPDVEAKTAAGEAWCASTGCTYRVITEQYFVDNYDMIPFSELTIPNIREKLAAIKYEANKQN